jgi:hypothetical protein
MPIINKPSKAKLKKYKINKALAEFLKLAGFHVHERINGCFEYVEFIKVSSMPLKNKSALIGK